MVDIGIVVVKVWRICLLQIARVVGRWSLLINGVRVGRKVRLECIPRIYRSPGARIELHDSVTLSGSLANTLCGCHVLVMTAGRGAEIVVGEKSGLSCSVVHAARSIRIGKNVNIGAGCTIVDSDFHPVDLAARRLHEVEKIASAAVVIEDDVWLGANVMVLKGVTVGAGSVIAAGSVVSRSIPPGVLAAGVPARVIKSL